MRPLYFFSYILVEEDLTAQTVCIINNDGSESPVFRVYKHHAKTVYIPSTGIDGYDNITVNVEE